MNKNIAVIRGDGIGPEIVGQAIRVLDKGLRTGDCMAEGCTLVTCTGMGDAVLAEL